MEYGIIWKIAASQRQVDPKNAAKPKAVERTETPDSEGDQQAAHLTGQLCYQRVGK
jgi:hypothetical protein